MGSSLPDYSLISRLGSLSLETHQAMQGNVSGKHRSAHRGSSVEFAEYRKYVPGDDTRRLDWKAYARSDRYYIKEFEADTNLRAYMVMDGSGSLAFKEDKEESKWDVSTQLASVLAYLAIEQGDGVGLTLSRENKDLYIPAFRRPAHLQSLFETLKNTRPHGKTTLIKTLHELAESVPKRSLLFIFSDFFVDLDELENALSHLRYRKHDVVLFHLMTKNEIEFHFDRPMRFVDMEGSESILADPQLIEEEYKSLIEDFLIQIKKRAHRTHADYKLVFTTDDKESVLREFLIGRMSKKGGRGT